MSHFEPHHTLPVRLTSFVGRARELTEVAGLLDGARLVTLVGAPGVGKTRLALQVANTLQTRFADGAWFVELAALGEPGLVPNAVAAALGIQEERQRPLLTTLTGFLESRHMLLILDNCEHLVSTCAMFVEDWLGASPGLQILATSREALRAEGETTWRVPSLSTPAPDRAPASGSDSVASLLQYEAVRLFVDRAWAAMPSFAVTAQNARIVARICQRLDGIPLAIELTAARVGALPLEQIAARLDDHLGLRIGGRRTAMPRQQTLRGAIDWSYGLLSDDERALLHRLAVFAGGWTIEAAERVCSGPSAVGNGEKTLATADGSLPRLASSSTDVLGLLLQLVEKSLVQMDDRGGAEPRYRLLEMLRQYGLERLRVSNEEAAIRRRHLSWYADLAERCQPGVLGPDGADWIDRLAFELDNFRAAMTWSLTDTASSSARDGLRIAGALQQLWLFRDHLSEGERWLSLTLATGQLCTSAGGQRDDGPAAGDGGGDRLLPDVRTGAHGAHPRVIALNALGILVRNQGGLEQAESIVQEALGFARTTQDRIGETHAIVTLAQIAQQLGDYQRSIALYEESLGTFKRLGDAWGTWRTLGTLGSVLLDLGDRGRARRLFEEGLDLARSMGFAWGMASQLRGLGNLACFEGDADRATALFKESLMWWAKLRATRGPNDSLYELGHIALTRGEPREATTHFAESLMLCREAGDRVGIARCLEGLAAVASTTGESTRAAQLLGSAASIREALGVSTSRVDIPRLEQAETRARARLGEEQYATAWAEGRDMPLNRAIESGRELVQQARTGVPDRRADTDSLKRPIEGAGAPLTAQQRLVAALVADGLTNRQIATRLVISERTVQAHVASILARLNFRNRAQIATWATQQGSKRLSDD